jgi:putative transposase
MQRKTVPGSIYHVLSRGVDKRKIFLDDEDHFRFIHDLFEFNDEQPLTNNSYNFNVIARRYAAKETRARKLLVEILAFCLMPNHYHLLLKPRTEKGMASFMKKLNMGYARYFNEKYKRSGALFEGRYKMVPVIEEAHFIHLPYYIHCNPLDLYAPEWRQRELKSHEGGMEFLENYRWSSFMDYIGKKNFPSVTQRGFLLKFFGGTEQHKQDITRWLKSLDFEALKGVSLEVSQSKLSSSQDDIVLR